MNTKLFKMLNESLAYATFSDADVEKNVKRVLTVSDGDLDAAGFEESAAIEDALEDLQSAIEDADPIEEDDDNDDDNEDEDESENDDEDEEEVEEDDEEDEDETD